MKKDLKELVKMAGEQGWRVEVRSSGHLMFFPPDKSKPAVTSGGTISDWRGMKNLKAQLKRSGMRFDGVMGSFEPMHMQSRWPLMPHFVLRNTTVQYDKDVNTGVDFVGVYETHEGEGHWHLWFYNWGTNPPTWWVDYSTGSLRMLIQRAMNSKKSQLDLGSYYGLLITPESRDDLAYLSAWLDQMEEQGIIE